MELKKYSLKRDVTLLLLVFYGLGNILGAGIYVLIGEIANIAGMYTPFSFLVAGIVAIFTALTYAELSSRFPYSAGGALYVQKAFNSKTLSITIGLIIAFSGILSSATILHGFNAYISKFVELSAYITSPLILLILCIIAIVGIGHSLKVATILTLIAVFGLLLIIYVGVDNIPFKTVTIEPFVPPFEIDIWYTISLGAFLAFYAFIGFEDMVNIAEEVKEPEKTMPRAIIISLLIATLLYMSVSIVSILAIEPQILGQSKAPLANVYETLTNKKPIVLSFIGIFAVINGVLIQIIMVSRIFYGMSMNGWLPAFFSQVNEKTRTPIFATVFACVTILIFTLWLPILTLASATSFLIFIIFTIMNVALIKIKIKNPSPEGIKSYPIWIPILGIIVNITMIMIQMSSYYIFNSKF